MIGQALVSEDLGDTKGATEFWRSVVGNPAATEQQIKLAWKHLEPGVAEEGAAGTNP